MPLIRRENIVGQRFGKWVVLEMLRPRRVGSGTKTMCLARCDCGAKKEVLTVNLRRGFSRSCGCGKHEPRPCGARAPSWKGGKRIIDGYPATLRRGHPNADRDGYVKDHVFAMSEHLGRPLKKGELVHHKNGIKADREIGNLELCLRGARSHPPGQRISDLVTWAAQILAEYAPELHNRTMRREKTTT